MIITQIIEFDYTTERIDNFISKNKVQELNSLFKNKCRNNRMVLEVLRVLRESEPEITVQGNNIYFSQSLQILVSCMVILPNEVFVDLKVNKIDEESSSVYLSNNHINAVLSGAEHFSVQRDKYLPVRVTQYSYTSYSNKIKALCDVYVPECKNYTAYLKEGFKVNDKLFEEINQYISGPFKDDAELKQSNLNIYNVFKDILYPFKNKRSVKPDELINISDIIEGYEFKSGLYVIDCRINDSGIIAYYSSADNYKIDDDIDNENIVEFYGGSKDDTNTDINVLIGQNIIYLLLYYASCMKANNDFMSVFNSKELLTNYKKLFQFYMASKK